MRPGPRKRGYDRAWQRLRRRVLAEEPDCRVRGCGRRAEHVDHIVAIALAPELRLERGNLQPLCAYHHRLLTVAYDLGTVRGVCDVAGQPLDPTHPWHATSNMAAIEALKGGARPRPQQIAAWKRKAVMRSRK